MLLYLTTSYTKQDNAISNLSEECDTLLVTMPSTQTMLPRKGEVSVRGVTCLLPKLHNR